MSITRNTLLEIYNFLSIDIRRENITRQCRKKLDILITKLEPFQQSDLLKKDIDAYVDNIVCLKPKNTELPTNIDKCQDETSGLQYYCFGSHCWDYYPLSKLIDGQLVCYKDSPTINNMPNHNCQSENININSEISILLIGYTAILKCKDGEMKHVFELTHPTKDTKVFATKTAKKALNWVEQINKYVLSLVVPTVKVSPDQSNCNVEILTTVPQKLKNINTEVNKCSLATDQFHNQNVQMVDMSTPLQNGLNQEYIWNVWNQKFDELEKKILAQSNQQPISNIPQKQKQKRKGRRKLKGRKKLTSCDKLNSRQKRSVKRNELGIQGLSGMKPGSSTSFVQNDRNLSVMNCKSERCDPPKVKLEKLDR